MRISGDTLDNDVFPQVRDEICHSIGILMEGEWSILASQQEIFHRGALDNVEEVDLDVSERQGGYESSGFDVLIHVFTGQPYDDMCALADGISGGEVDRIHKIFYGVAAVDELEGLVAGGLETVFDPDEAVMNI
jgi:hypothetical protein